MTGPLDPQDRLIILLQQARAGDKQAAGELLEIYKAYMLLVATRWHPSDLMRKFGPSDIVQDARCKAFETIDRFQGETEAELRGWLRRIVVRTVLTQVRKFRETQKNNIHLEVPFDPQPRSQDRRLDVAAPDDSPSKELLAKERAEALDAAMSQLRPDDRLVLELRHRDHLNFEEIGEKMGRSGEAARKLWGRAVAKLKAILGSA